MPRRKVVAGLTLVGSIAGAILVRRRARRRDRIDVYFEDGSMISLGDGADGATILPLARQILETAGG
jgi:hypothetical protein